MARLYATESVDVLRLFDSLDLHHHVLRPFPKAVLLHSVQPSAHVFWFPRGRLRAVLHRFFDGGSSVPQFREAALLASAK